jgi:signal transduction histidine kinase
MDSRPRLTASTDVDDDAWDLANPWVGRAIAAATVVASVLAVADDPRPATVAAGVVLSAVVILALRRLEHADQSSYLRWWLPILGVIAIVWFVAVSTSTAFFLALFGLFWLFWSTVDPPLGLVPPLLLTALLVIANIRAGSGWSDAILSGAISYLLGAAFALFIRSVIDQSQRRRDLIAELQDAHHLIAAAQREAGVLAERERLSHEIHDTLAQGFTSIILLAQAGRHDRIEQVARDNLAEARRLVRALDPPALDGASLPDALQRVVDAFALDSGATASLEVVGDERPLHRSEEVALVRTVQESLANVRKHANATSVVVRLAYDDPVRLTVTDDGLGFDPSRLDGDGFGLRGLAARLADVSGSLDVRSSPGSGTTVEVRVP